MFSMLKKNKNKIIAPISGRMIPLEKVDDEVFSSGMMGKGIAIIPTESTFLAPATGTITLIPETKHAFGMKLDNGMEILVHIGIDTVLSKGEGFKVLVKQGTRVKQGTPIIEMDKQYFESKNIKLETPVLILNSEQYQLKYIFNEDCIGGQTEIIKYTKIN